MKFIEFKEKQLALVAVIENLKDLVQSGCQLTPELRRSIDELYDLHTQPIEHNETNLRIIDETNSKPF